VASNNSQIQQNNICQFCQSKIKSKEDFITCPSCLSVYHLECWYENKGCAVYGCNYKILNAGEGTEIFNIENIIVNAEYLINKRQYSEAMNECSRVLFADPDNFEAKKLYNKAITLVNVKLKILNDADTAFTNKDYKSAEIYYKNALSYLDESDQGTVKARLEVIKDAIPAMQRKIFYKNAVTLFLTILIFMTVAFLAYYYIYLEEDRDYYAIERDDSKEDINIMENQIFRYEHFIRKYENGKFRIKAGEKISQISAVIIQKIYKDDWKTSLKYLNKIDENTYPKLHNDLFGMLYTSAEKEYTKYKTNAKHLNTQRKFLEAKNETEKALSVINYFPGTNIDKEKMIVSANLNLLNKKISFLIRYKEIEKELNDKTEELKKSHEVDNGGLVKINAIITDEKSPTLYLAKNIFDNNLIALKTNEISNYKKGDVVILECKKSGRISLNDENNVEMTVNLYKFGNNQGENLNSSSFDLQSLVQRLSYLKSQKTKIDSLLSISL
jgi:hypothetical protein